jgi:hypothetical protein
VSAHASKIASVSYNFVLPNLTNREGVVGVSLRDRAAMDESMKITVFAGVVGLLVFVAFYRYNAAQATVIGQDYWTVFSAKV